MKKIVFVLHLMSLNCASALTAGCSTIPTVQNADIMEESLKDKYTEGDLLHFTCKLGYVYRKISYMCHNQEWTRFTRGECTLKPCELPEDIVHGRYEIIRGTDLVFGTVIKYICNEGFQMVSKEDTRTCLLEGWSNHLPQCEVVQCSANVNTDGLIVTGLPEDGYIATGHMLHFQCATTGLTLKGDSETVCLSDGTWSRPFPTCEALAHTPVTASQNWERNVCGPPPQVNNADIISVQKKIYRHGDTVKFQCQNLHVLNGDAFVKCNRGSWSRGPTCLKPCTVTVEEMRERNLDLRFIYTKKLYAKHEEPIEFMCAYGKRKASKTPFRQYCNDGEITLPTCL